MRVARWLAMGVLAPISACGSADSRGLFTDIAVGGGPVGAASSSGRGGSADSGGSAPVAGAKSPAGGSGNDGGSELPNSASGQAGEAPTAEDGGDGGDGGSGATSEPTCEETCIHGTCTSGAPAKCVCESGFVSERLSCRRPKSCSELHRAEPNLPNGAYTLQPASAKTAFTSYCSMSAEEGGWTLVLNAGTEFDPTSLGAASELAYEAKGTNLAYSNVVLEFDVMLDVRMDAIASETYTARAVIRGVHAETRGHTVRELFMTGPHYLEAEDNSNLRLTSSIQCNFSPVDLGPLFCQSPVVVLGYEDSSCRPSAQRFAISGAASYTAPWQNCAGWPQATTVSGQQRFPNSFRVWIR